MSWFCCLVRCLSIRILTPHYYLHISSFLDLSNGVRKLPSLFNLVLSFSTKTEKKPSLSSLPYGHRGLEGSSTIDISGLPPSFTSYDGRHCGRARLENSHASTDTCLGLQRNRKMSIVTCRGSSRCQQHLFWTQISLSSWWWSEVAEGTVFYGGGVSGLAWIRNHEGHLNFWKPLIFFFSFNP